MKKAPAPAGAKHLSQLKYSAYAERKDIDHKALLELGCEVKEISFSRFDSEGQPSAPWHGIAIFRPLFTIAGGQPAGHERILDEKVQRSPDDKPNDKYVTKGAKTAGAATPIGCQLDNLASLQGRVIVCAGFADGYRLHQATGLPVVCGVGEATIPGNVRLLQQHYPSIKPIAAADNDTAGKQAGSKAGCNWTHPESAKDWSDVYQQSGQDAVLAEFEDGIRPAPEPLTPEPKVEPEDNKKAQCDKIVDFVQDHHNLFHDANGATYVQDKKTGEVRRLTGKTFRHWLTAAFYEQHEKAVRDQALREARMTLEGIAMREEQMVHLRAAQSCDGYWLDLGEPGNNAAIYLRAGDWMIVDAPVMFCRSESMEPLPRPKPGGDVQALWKIANVPEDKQLLVIAWLIECLRPDTPYPILEIFAEQGAAKSTTQVALRRIIDPNAADLRAAVKSPDDLYVTGNANFITSLENVSHLSPQIQDAMCVIATGGGYAKRKLYTDSEEEVINLKRPIMLNGIVAAITQQDAVSRAISLELPVIQDAQPRNALEAQYERNRTSILGGILDIAAKALKRLPEMALPPDQRPRLVEFAYLGMAVAEVLGERPEAFMEQFNAAKQDGLERTLDASPVAAAIRDWAEINPDQSKDHPVKYWLELLEGHRPSSCNAWPRSPKGLGDAMRRAAPALRQLGIECTCLGKVGSSVKWRIGQKHRPNTSRQSLEVVRGRDNQHDLTTSTTSNPQVSLTGIDSAPHQPANKRVF